MVLLIGIITIVSVFNLRPVYVTLAFLLNYCTRY